MWILHLKQQQQTQKLLSKSKEPNQRADEKLADKISKRDNNEQEKLLDNAIEAEAINANTAVVNIPESKVELAIRNIDKQLKNNNLVVNEDIKGIEIDLSIYNL